MVPKADSFCLQEVVKILYNKPILSVAEWRLDEGSSLPDESKLTSMNSWQEKGLKEDKKEREQKAAENTQG